MLDQVATGELDAHLTAIFDAVRARRELLHTVDVAKALAMLHVGDPRSDQPSRPSLATCTGSEAASSKVDEEAAIVCIHRPVGRFTSGEIRCPSLVFDRLDPAA